MSGAGRTLAAADSSNSYASSATYAPFGALTAMNNGSSINVNDSYNSRMQPLALSATGASGTILSLVYDFHAGSGDNGNVYQIANGRAATRTANYFYDPLNRIAEAYSSGPNWGEIYTIDAVGNLTSRAGVAGKTYTEPLSQSAGTSNQLSGYSYDVNGNMTQNGSATYLYDAENRIKTTAGVTYTYNGDGERVMKSNGMLYWGGGEGGALSESDLSGNIQHEYIFFNGKRTARIDLSNSSVHYYFADHLGTTAVVTNSTGSLPFDEDLDYYPYGGIVTGSTDNVPQNYKFNGKERDAESGLDNFGARFDASTLGRFMTPDWAAKPTTVPYANFGNPQSLNLYSFVENNPTTVGDPDGHAPLGTGMGGVECPAGTDCQKNKQQQWAQNTSYSTTILGQKVSVSISGGTAEDRAAIQGRLNGAIGDINQHADDLSASDTKTIHNIKSLTVDDSQRTGANVKTGNYNMKSSYVMSEGSTAPWLASTMGHDAYHMTQFQQGEIYNKETAPRLEREANQFQMRVGATFGLTQSQIDYIRNDTHTLYNTPPY